MEVFFFNGMGEVMMVLLLLDFILILMISSIVMVFWESEIIIFGDNEGDCNRFYIKCSMWINLWIIGILVVGGVVCIVVVICCVMGYVWGKKKKKCFVVVVEVEIVDGNVRVVVG